jgi:hypothetical protein
MTCALLQTPAAARRSTTTGRNRSDVQSAPAAVSVRQLTYAQLDGMRNAATLVMPAASSTTPRPAVLYLHWYEPPRPTSNRTEFLAEAVELAAEGTVSLLIDTPWTGESWFPKRDSAKDYEFTIQQAKDVRRAIDVLLAQPGIDRTRVAVVGHDFGAMWGALAVAADARVTHFVYMAGTRSFTDGICSRRSARGGPRGLAPSSRRSTLSTTRRRSRHARCCSVRHEGRFGKTRLHRDGRHHWAGRSRPTSSATSSPHQRVDGSPG